jgi:predicted nucleic acid-binding protein
MKKVVIDTDVILDFFFDREPFSENAARILSLCEKKRKLMERILKMLYKIMPLKLMVTLI